MPSRKTRAERQREREQQLTGKVFMQNFATNHFLINYSAQTSCSKAINARNQRHNLSLALASPCCHSKPNSRNYYMLARAKNALKNNNGHKFTAFICFYFHHSHYEHFIKITQIERRVRARFTCSDHFIERIMESPIILSSLHPFAWCFCFIIWSNQNAS